MCTRDLHVHGCTRDWHVHGCTRDWHVHGCTRKAIFHQTLPFQGKWDNKKTVPHSKIFLYRPTKRPERKSIFIHIDMTEMVWYSV